MMALSVSSNFNFFWRGSMSKIFSEERALRRKEQKRGFTFPRFFFTATSRHKRLTKKKFQGLDNGLDLHFLYRELLTNFFNNFFYGCCLLRDNVYLKRYVDTGSCCCLLEKQNKKSAFVVHLNALPT